MHIAYLDQNKWIDLARAVNRPAEYPESRKVLETLVERAKAKQVVLPLTQTNIYETHKINDPARRQNLAHVQATLSQGLVFRGRHKRLEMEVTDVLRRAYGLPLTPRDPHWFLSNIFFEATLEWNDPRLGGAVSGQVRDSIRRDPARALFDYLTATPEEVRRLAVSKFSEGADKLRANVETRRQRDANETMDMRRRIQGALLVTSELDLIRSFIAKAEIPGQTESEILRDQCQRIVTDSPTYNIEREIVVRLEAQQNRAIQENDFRDMQTFSAVVAYADIVIAENQFSSLAKQAGFHKSYRTIISPDLLALPSLLETSRTAPGGASSIGAAHGNVEE
jgi:hypothetical protein